MIFIYQIFFDNKQGYYMKFYINKYNKYNKYNL